MLVSDSPMALIASHSLRKTGSIRKLTAINSIGQIGTPQKQLARSPLISRLVDNIVAGAAEAMPNRAIVVGVSFIVSDLRAIYGRE